LKKTIDIASDLTRLNALAKKCIDTRFWAS